MKVVKTTLMAVVLGTGGFTASLAAQKAVAAGLEEVIVTARKREENLQNTPVSVTALSSEALSQANLNELTSIERQTPNLSFTVGQGGGGSTVNAFIRGVGETDFIVTTDPAVGLYLDGVYLSRVFGANMELDDIERIEVLRGPQGTLFGKNSIGGAINVTTRKPQGDTSGKLGVTAGSFDFLGASFYGQTALTDTLSASVSYLQKNADGWQRRAGPDAGEVDVKSARAIFNFQPGDNFSSTLTLDWIDQDQTGYPNVIVAAGTSTFSDLWNSLNPGQPCCTVNGDIDKSGATGPLPNDSVEGTGVAWINTWQHDNFQLKSITSYREMDALFGRDGDNGPFNYSGDIHDTNHEQISQEFQLSSEGESLSWTVGAYYFQEDSRDDTDLIIIEGLGTSVSYDNKQETTSQALYGQVSYSITEQMEVYAGLRYTTEEKKFRQTVLNYDFNVPFSFPVPGMPADSCDYAVMASHFNCTQDWNETSPKLGLSYQVDDDVMLYGQVSRGFRSGGYNGRAFGSAADLQEYEPETLISYELGAKGEWFDRTLRVNSAVFYNDYDDIQILVVQGASVAIENASSASIFGAELEATWLPSSQLRLSAGLGYIKDDSDGWVDLTGDFTDTELKHTPEWSGHLSTDYTLELGDIGTLLLRANVKYKSDYYVDGVNTEVLKANAHSLVDAGVILTSTNERWEMALQGENLTDKRVINAGFDGLAFFGYVEGYYNPPRRYSLKLTYRF